MLKKLMMFAGLLGGSVLFSGQALAAADWGACTPDGGTHVFSATLNKTITDTSKNASGMVFRDFWSWDLGGITMLFVNVQRGLLRHRHIIKLLPPSLLATAKANANILLSIIISRFQSMFGFRDTIRIIKQRHFLI